MCQCGKVKANLAVFLENGCASFNERFTKSECKYLKVLSRSFSLNKTKYPLWRRSRHNESFCFQDQEVLEGNQDLPELAELPAVWALLDPRDPGDRRENQENKESLDRQDRADPEDHLEFLVALEVLGKVDLMVPVELKDQEVKLEIEVHQDLQELSEGGTDFQTAS